MATRQINFTDLMARTNCNQGTKYTYLKDHQKAALTNANEQDSVSMLPTGYGKTVVIQNLPYLNEEKPTAVIVIEPLNVIIEEQKLRFGDTALLLDEEVICDMKEGVETESIRRLNSGDFTFLLGHPETLAHELVLERLKSLSEKISHVVVDEAHIILSWGKSKFRPAFLNLKLLKKTLPKAKTVALTATATPQAINEITTALQMESPAVLKISPDRPNVYIEVKRRPSSTGGQHTVDNAYKAVVDPYLDQLKKEGSSFPRTIMYMPLDWCGKMHLRARGKLLDCPSHSDYQPPDAEIVQAHVAQYHAPQTSQMKALVAKTMQLPESPLRLLMATEAYGMGADSPNVRRVVHVGVPSTLETYVQEIGRCARDGQAGVATLYYNSSDIGSNIEHITDHVRTFCQLTTCRREYLMKYFGFKLEKSHNFPCCDNCNRPTSAATKQKKAPRKKENEEVRNLLSQYFQAVNAEVVGSVIAELQTGLSEKLAAHLACEPDQFCTSDAVLRELPYLDKSVVDGIAHLVQVGLDLSM